MQRQRVLRVIAETYERFGFVPLETPALEYADVLTGKYGDEGEKLLYRFRDQGDREVALRYDLTVPLARVVAQYPELPKPFRRYQIAQVWRAENTQKGRFREFTQCDVDVVGTENLLADGEIIQVAASVLDNLGFERYIIRFNNRKLLNGMLSLAKIPATDRITVLRSLDKWQKIGEEGVRKELAGILSEHQLSDITDLLPKAGEEFFTWSKRMSPKFLTDALAREGWLELNQLIDLLKNSPNSEAFQPDILLARGLDYYTGTIIEATLPDAPELGSVFGGGRYDKLIGMFTGKDVPAVGVAAGVDRLVAAMEELGMAEERASTADVLVLMMEKSMAAELHELAAELRDAGIKTELYYDAVKLDKQLKYADKLGIPLALLYGSKEREESNATLKVLATKEQKTVHREKVADAVKRLLSASA